MADQPSPEVNKLNYFVGEWITEGTILPGPWGVGGPFSWAETTEWMAGKFFLIGRWDFRMPADLGGDGEEIFIIGYDSKRGLYTFDAFSSLGLHQISQGVCNGDIWTWSSTAIYDGQETQQRMTFRILSPATYSLKLEHSRDAGDHWVTFMEGKAQKR